MSHYCAAPAALQAHIRAYQRLQEEVWHIGQAMRECRHHAAVAALGLAYAEIYQAMNALLSTIEYYCGENPRDWPEAKR